MDEKRGMRSLRDILVTDKEGNIISLLEALAGKVDKSQLESNEGVVVVRNNQGNITINNAPTANTEAANKKYVDDKVLELQNKLPTFSYSDGVLTIVDKTE